MRSGPVARGTSQPRPYPAPALEWPSRGLGSGEAARLELFVRRLVDCCPTASGLSWNRKPIATRDVGRRLAARLRVRIRHCQLVVENRAEPTTLMFVDYPTVPFARQDPIALECLDLDARRIDKVLEPRGSETRAEGWDVVEYPTETWRGAISASSWRSWCPSVAPGQWLRHPGALQSKGIRRPSRT